MDRSYLEQLDKGEIAIPPFPVVKDQVAETAVVVERRGAKKKKKKKAGVVQSEEAATLVVRELVSEEMSRVTLLDDETSVTEVDEAQDCVAERDLAATGDAAATEVGKDPIDDDDKDWVIRQLAASSGKQVSHVRQALLRSLSEEDCRKLCESAG